MDKSDPTHINMKKTLVLLALIVLAVSCKNSEEKSTTTEEVVTEVSENLLTYRGEFIFTEEGAVLKGNNYIYGVAIDDKCRELADRVAPIKNEPFDMVPVVVKGVVAKNPAVAEGAEGWEELITIKEIVEVSETPAEADIKLQETN